MAESAAATAAPSSGPGGKGSSSSGPWWKSLTSRKKPKDPPAAAPAPPRPPADPSEPPCAPTSPADSLETQQPNLGGGGSSYRRNLKISRSGRFKEKRKVRATLLAAKSPQQLFEGGAGGPPALPGEETP